MREADFCAVDEAVADCLYEGEGGMVLRVEDYALECRLRGSLLGLVGSVSIGRGSLACILEMSIFWMVLRISGDKRGAEGRQESALYRKDDNTTM